MKVARHVGFGLRLGRRKGIGTSLKLMVSTGCGMNTFAGERRVACARRAGEMCVVGSLSSSPLAEVYAQVDTVGSSGDWKWGRRVRALANSTRPQARSAPFGKSPVNHSTTVLLANAPPLRARYSARSIENCRAEAYRLLGLRAS